MRPENEVTEGSLLGGRLRYRQFAAGHRSGFEPVLLAASVAARPGERVLEAGTGAGAGLLCLAARVPQIHGIGLEIVPDLADLARENFRNNGLLEVDCWLGGLEQARLEPVFDHAMANPPWHGASSTASRDGNRALAHHARPGLLEDWIAALTRALKPRGRLVLILPAARLAAACACLRSQRYGAVTLFPLWPQAGKAAKLMIISAQRGAKGADRILPGLVLHDAAGVSAAAEAILRDGAPTLLGMRA